MAISTQDIHVVLYHHENILATSQIHINSKPSEKCSFPNCTKSGELLKTEPASCWHSLFLREEGGEWKLCSTKKIRCQWKNKLAFQFWNKEEKKDLQLVVCWEILSQHQEPWRNKTKDGSKKVCSLVQRKEAYASNFQKYSFLWDLAI